jgi:hypothetical protein
MMSPNQIPHATLSILPIDNPQLLLVIGITIIRPVGESNRST